MSHGSLKSILAIGCSILILVACKKKEAPPVIEEAPPAAVETDTSAALTEEPALQQVGKEAKPKKETKAKSMKATVHQSAKADHAGFSEGGRYVVQVSIFKSKQQAAGLVEKLANAGFPAYVAEVENPTPELAGTWHRVRIGNFSSISEAKAFGDNTLSGMGYQYWVDNKKNDGMGGDGSASAPAEEPAPAPKRSAKRAKAAPAEAPAVTPSFDSAPSEPVAAPPVETPVTEAPAAPESQFTPPAELPGAGAVPVVTPPKVPVPAVPPAVKAAVDSGKVNLDEW